MSIAAAGDPARCVGPLLDEGAVSQFDPRYGEAVPLGGQIARLVAPNAGPFTGAGTNTYLLGTDEVMIVDPGPDDADHIASIVRAVGGRTTSHILITHTHRDHVGGLPMLQRSIDAPTVAEGPHRAARPLKAGEENPFLYAADNAFTPDMVVADGDTVANRDVVVEAVATPGHTANHLAFSLGADCLTGDHVMGWSTTVIAPPDGTMGAYLKSLDRLLRADHTRYLPGHGDAITDPRKAVNAMRAHRLMRERAILERIAGGDSSIAAVVEALYVGIDPRLKRAAGLSVQAHLEKLEEEGRVAAAGFGVDAHWSAVP